jgi:hypothetical protein
MARARKTWLVTHDLGEFSLPTKKTKKAGTKHKNAVVNLNSCLALKTSTNRNRYKSGMKKKHTSTACAFRPRKTFAPI